MPALKNPPAPITRIGKSVSAETAPRNIVAIPSDKLHFYPANPAHRVTPEAIADLVKLIDEFDQREPVRVRALQDPIGHYQVLSGHRRTAACKQLGRSVKCEIVQACDEEALREVMLGNAERQDLSAIERAELLLTMINHGMDRDEAGRMFGLESESGIKNTLRLLKLPESIRKLVQSGELPARAARVLVPWAEAAMLLDDLAKNRDSWRWRKLVDDGKFELSSRDWRPMDGTTKYDAGWEYEKAVRRFDLQAIHEKDRKNLAIVDLPLGPKGKVISVAQNVKLFDHLNKPHLLKSKAYAGTGKEKVKAKAPAGKSLTPAELKAARQRKDKEAAERLKKRLPIWRRRMIRTTLATMVPAGHVLIETSLPWMIIEAGTSDASTWMLRAARTLGTATKKDHKGELDHCIASIAFGKVGMTDRLWRLLLWPQSIDWVSGKIIAPVDDDDLPIDLPEKLAFGADYQSVDDELGKMMQLASLGFEDAWERATLINTPQRYLLNEFLGLHTTGQLLALAREWKLDVFDTDKKSALIDHIMVKHLAGDGQTKRLPLPKCLQVPARKKQGAK